MDKNFKYFIGVDPGSSSFAFVLDISGSVVGSTPLEYRNLWQRKVLKPKILIDRIIELIGEQNLDWSEVFVLIEQVGSYKQGRNSAFTFGANAVGVLLVFETVGATVQTITPNEWKKKLKVTSEYCAAQGANEKEQQQFLKLLAAQRAREFFPSYTFTKTSKKDEEESALLAYLAWKSCTKYMKDKNTLT